MGNACSKVSQTTKTCNSCRHNTIFNYRITYTFLHKTFGLSLHMEGIHLMSNDSLLCFILIVKCIVSCLIYYMLLKFCPEYTINNILTGAPMEFIAIVLSASQILNNVSNLLAWTGHFSYFYGWEKSLVFVVFQETCIPMSLLEEKTNHHFPFLSWHEAGAPSLSSAGIPYQGISTLDCFGTSLSCWTVCSMNSSVFLGSRWRKQPTTCPNLPREQEKTTVWSSSLEGVLQNEAAAPWEMLCPQLLMCLHWECTTMVWVAALLGCHTQKGSNTTSQIQLLPLDDVQLPTFPDTMTAIVIQQKLQHFQPVMPWLCLCGAHDHHMQLTSYS